MNAPLRHDTTQPSAGQIPAEELARRRLNAKRLGWLLGAVVVLVYALGFLLKR